MTDPGHPGVVTRAYDPDPAATLTIQAEIDAALAAGDIVSTTNNGRTLGHYYCCPWGALY